MIARVWHGYTKPDHADAYEAMLKPELLPGISNVQGYQSSYLLRRNVGDEVEFVTILLQHKCHALCIDGPVVVFAIRVVGQLKRTQLIHVDRKKIYRLISARVCGDPRVAIQRQGQDVSQIEIGVATHDIHPTGRAYPPLGGVAEFTAKDAGHRLPSLQLIRHESFMRAGRCRL